MEEQVQDTTSLDEVEKEIKQEEITKPVDSVDTNTKENKIDLNPQSIEVKYASFGKRLLAGIIDFLIIGFVSGVAVAMFGGRFDGGKYENPYVFLIGSVYAVIMLYKYGATLGKMAMGIKVVNEDTKENPDVITAILREVVGKFISAFVLLLGYFWMLWDPNKQTWHDKISKTIVIESK